MTVEAHISVEEINRRAYGLYIERGREHGSDVDDWVKAEKELTANPVIHVPNTKRNRATRSSRTYPGNK
jgi:hypothetical protein